MSNPANTNNQVIHLKDENNLESNDHTSEHGHELGGSLGMAAMGLAGGIAGAVAGPMGVVAGAAVGGAIGGIAGEQIARDINPTHEEAYWEAHYHTRPYVTAGNNFSSYRAAYRSGINGYVANPNASFDNLEPSLRNNWNIARGDSKLEWAEARHAANDAFKRLSNASM
jgi:hypothetical protein